MSFGNVPRDFSFSSIAALRSTASKSINGFFSANIRKVGALVQYERSPDIWVTAEADTVPATQLGDIYTLPANINGLSLNFDGSVLAVGSLTLVAGSVLSILTNTAGFYYQQTIPLPPDAVGVTNGSAYLSDNGKILAFGSGTDNGGIGAVWIYADVAGVWTLQGTKITGPGEIGNGNFGQTVSLSSDGTLLAVGSPQETPYGAAYIFNLTSLSSPIFVARLLGSPVDVGGVFGWNVALSADGSTLAVGASSNLVGAGSFYVFTKVQGQGLWLQQAYLPAPSGFPSQFLGYILSISADGNTIAASSLQNAVMYYRSGANWSAGSVLPLPYDLVGVSTQYCAFLSQDGNILCTSSQNNNNNTGGSWIFIQGPPGTWTRDGPALIGTGAPAAPPTQQSYTVISGNGKTAATQSYIATGYVWVFV